MYCLEAYAARIEDYQMLSKLDLEHFKSNIMLLLLVQEDKNLCNLNPRYYSFCVCAILTFVAANSYSVVDNRIRKAFF